jgi:meiotically up-regulated gene 157 (Mug157) protein
MIYSCFRPSDDACIFPFLIPSNLSAAAALDRLREIHETALNDPASGRDCASLAGEVREGLAKYATAVRPQFGEV